LEARGKIVTTAFLPLDARGIWSGIATGFLQQAQSLRGAIACKIYWRLESQNAIGFLIGER